MADNDPLFGNTLGPNDLGLFQQSVLASDPFALTGRSLDAWQPDYRTWSPVETGATAFAKSFLSGILGNYARQNAADQVNSVIGVLPELAKNPAMVGVPEGVDQNAFAALKATAALRNQAREQTLADLMQKVGIAGLTKKAEILGENEAYGAIAGTGSKHPSSPGYKVDQDLFKIEQGYTDKLLSGAEPQRVMGINRASTNILEAIKKNNPLAAATAIFEFAKLQDPAGTVREADEMRVADPGGPLGMFAQIHNQIMGEGKLTPQAKQSMRELVPILQKNTFREYDQLRDSYLDAARGYGADPSRIRYLKPTDLSSFLVDDAQPKAETVQAPNGKTYIFID